MKGKFSSLEQISMTQQNPSENRCALFSVECVLRHVHEKSPKYQNLRYLNDSIEQYYAHLIRFDHTKKLLDFLLTSEEHVSFETNLDSTSLPLPDYTVDELNMNIC